MNKAQLEQQFAALGMRPGARFGQNFMIDGNLLDFIVRTAAPVPGETILEIGPGFGALTGRLLAAGAQVVAIELDKRLVDFLRRHFADAPFTLIQGDACRIDLEKVLAGETGCRCLANLPYAITSPFLGKVLTLAEPPVELLLLLQEETARRLTATVNTRAYSSLTVGIQVVYEVSLLRVVPPEVFHPRPRVNSALLRFRRRADHPAPDRRCRLQQVVRTAFGERRKMMRKALARRFGESATAAAMAALGISPAARAQNLSPNDFLGLEQLLREPGEQGKRT